MDQQRDHHWIENQTPVVCARNGDESKEQKQKNRWNIFSSLNGFLWIYIDTKTCRHLPKERVNDLLKVQESKHKLPFTEEY